MSAARKTMTDNAQTQFTARKNESPRMLPGEIRALREGLKTHSMLCLPTPPAADSPSRTRKLLAKALMETLPTDCALRAVLQAIIDAGGKIPDSITTN